MNCGEGEFPIRRLSQIASLFEAKHGLNSKEYLERVHIENCFTIDDAIESLVMLNKSSMMRSEFDVILFTRMYGFQSCVERWDFDSLF